MIRKAVQKAGQKSVGLTQKSIGLTRQSIGLTPNSAIAEFCLRLQTASCILSASKYFQCLKTLALAGGKKHSEVVFFNSFPT